MTCPQAVGMTNQDKIAYLKRYKTLDKEIDRLVEEVSRWRDKLEKVTTVYSGQPMGGGSIYGSTEAIVAKIVDLEREINTDIDRLVDLKKNIEETIMSVKDARERMLLQYRYLDGKSWEQVAVDMGYNYRHTTKMHGWIIGKLNMPHNAPIDM